MALYFYFNTDDRIKNTTTKTKDKKMAKDDKTKMKSIEIKLENERKLEIVKMAEKSRKFLNSQINREDS